MIHLYIEAMPNQTEELLEWLDRYEPEWQFDIENASRSKGLERVKIQHEMWPGPAVWHLVVSKETAMLAKLSWNTEIISVDS
jgi:hypothetical protein